MTEIEQANGETAETTEAAVVKVKSSFGEVLSTIEPAPVREMIVAKLDEHLQLILAQNGRVFAIRESKETDPNSVDYQDATWRRVAAEESDPEIVAKEKKYQTLIAQAEKLLLGYEDKDGKHVDGLRDLSKKHMREALSEDEIKAKRKEYNDAKEVISTSRIAAETMAQMADGMLALTGNSFKDGVISLLPDIESLMNARGKKSSGGNTRSADGYAARIGSATIDGEDAAKNEKYSFAILADKLNARFNAKRFPANEVTPNEIEEAFYSAAGLSWRDKGNIPETLEFTFTKDVEKQNPNDDKTTSAPETVKIGFVKWVPAEKPETTETTETTDETPDESAPVETA